MIHVLDDEKTVVTFSQGNVIDKDDCLERIDDINKIMKNRKSIKIAGYCDLDDKRTVEETPYFYPGLGTYYGNGRHLQFMMIWNETGKCFDAQYGKANTCPRDDFSNLKSD